MHSTTEFAGRFLTLCTSNLVLQGMGFLYRIVLSRFAGAEGLGVYRLASSVYAILHALCLSGTTLSCTRFASVWKASGRIGAISHLLRWIFTIFLLFFAVPSSLVWCGRFRISEALIGDHSIAAAIPILLICLFLTSIENIIKSLMIGLGYIENAITSELIEQVIRILALLCLLTTYPTKDSGAITALIFGASVVSEVVSASIMVCMYLRLKKTAAADPPKAYRRDVLKSAVPVSLAAVFNNFIASSATFLLPGRLMSLGMNERAAVSELGILTGAAAPIITLPMALVSSLCTVTLPEISADNAHPELMRRLAKRAVRTLGLIAIPITALLLPLAPMIARLLFHQVIPSSMFTLMGVSCVASYYQMLAGCFMNGCGKQGVNAFIATCGEIFQLFMVWLLTGMPKFGLYGYVIAQCIAPILVSVCIFAVLHQQQVLRFEWKNAVLEPIACGITLFLWTRIFLAFYSGFANQWQALIMTGLSSIALYFGLLYLCRIKIGKYLANTVLLRSFRPMFY